MAYRANPFLERMSERTSDQESFVCFAKILEKLAEDAFEVLCICSGVLPAAEKRHCSERSRLRPSRIWNGQAGTGNGRGLSAARASRVLTSRPDRRCWVCFFMRIGLR